MVAAVRDTTPADDMSAEVLRRAAALMRERAEGSTDGPWVAAEQTHGEWFGIQSRWTALGTAFEASEAAHIASWHPAVALAVADWLDNIAHNWDAQSGGCQADATDVARAYLGDSS